jgi:hypothetical protein
MAQRHVPGRGSAVLAVVALTVSAAAGCAVVGERTVACVEWVWFDTPADALDDATVAVRTDGPAPVVGTADLFGVDARVHAVRVVEVLKGSDVRAGDELAVAATPATCTGEEVYPDGDPLDASGDLVLLLHRDEDAGLWRTITPEHGVVPATVDGHVPDSWPAG